MSPAPTFTCSTGCTPPFKYQAYTLRLTVITCCLPSQSPGQYTLPPKGILKPAPTPQPISPDLPPYVAKSEGGKAPLRSPSVCPIEAPCGEVHALLKSMRLASATIDSPSRPAIAAGFTYVAAASFWAAISEPTMERSRALVLGTA